MNLMERIRNYWFIRKDNFLYHFKFVKAGFHATKSERVNAPLIDELPIAYDPANNTYLALGDVVGKAFADGKNVL